MGGVMRAIGGGISNIVHTAESAIGGAVMNVAKSIAPSVTDMLENVAHSAIGTLGGGIQNLVGGLPLVGNLLSSLVGKGVQGLDGLADKGIQSLIQSGLGALGNVLNVGGQQVTTPSLQQRANTAPQSTAQLQEVLQQVLAALQGKAPAASTGGTAATGGKTPTTSSSAATGTGGTASTGNNNGVVSGDPADTIINKMGSLGKMPDPSSVDFNDPKQAAEFQQKMTQWTNTMQLLSNLLRMMADLQKGVIGNIR